MDKQIDKNILKKQRRHRTIKITSLVAGIAAVSVGLFMLVGGKSVKSSDLRFGTVEHGALETSVAGSGRVVPAFEEIVNSPLASRITAVYAMPGDSVRRGTPLLQLDLRNAETDYQKLNDNRLIKANQLRQLRLDNRTQLSDLATQIDIKEMEVNRLTIEVDNERRLDSIGSGTGDRVRQAETALATGRLQLEGLRQRLSNERERLAALEDAAVLDLGNSTRDLQSMERTLSEGRIPAPIDGVITFLNNKIGSTVAAGERVAVVGDLSNFKISADVPEGSSYKVQTGANAIVRLGNVELRGTVANVEPQSNSGSVPFTIKLEDASNSRLRPGIRVQVYVDYGYKENVLIIPNGSYYSGPGPYTLFVKDGNKLHRRTVRLGESNRQYVEVISGIQAGEIVVTSDLGDLAKYKTLSIE